jgi:hypothetical protein
MSSLWLEHRPKEWRSLTVPSGQLLTGRGVGLPGVGVLGLPGRAVLFVHAGTFARVNGEPVVGGMRVLEHRDEVLTEAARCFFSGESAPVVTPFVLGPGGRVPTCPVCRGPVREGMLAVACPGCGRRAHQLEGRACWSYAPTCRFCNHPTSFAAEATWRPDVEDDLG